MSPPVPGDDVLSAYLDDEVTDVERAEVEAALVVSPDRRAMLGELASARAAVRALPGPEAPAGFLAGLEQAVVEQAGRERSPDARSSGGRSSGGRSSGGRSSGGARGRLAWVAGGVAAAALVAAMVVPASDRVDPDVPARVDTHVARASLSDDPVSGLAPVAAATGTLRR